MYSPIWVERRIKQGVVAKTLVQSKCFKDVITLPITAFAMIINIILARKFIGRSCLEVCVEKDLWV